jgi:predicted TIM-barrel fold metal-dependent hydrolase
VAGDAGYIVAYVTQGRGDSALHVARVHWTVRRSSDARWRIAAEAVTMPGLTAVKPVSGGDLIALLDSAGIHRAVVHSMAYVYGGAGRAVEDEYAKVKMENDWTSQEVSRFPDRLQAFCSFNPLKDYALEELSRCARDPQLRVGLKLHFANSGVDYHNGAHVEQLRRVFRAANAVGMAIVVHMRPSLSSRVRYGTAEARIFLDDLVSAAPDVPIQIAHLAGAGGYDGPTDQALGVFTDAVTQGDPRTRNLYFDLTGVVGVPGLVDVPVEELRRATARIRQLPVTHILFGSDAATGGNLAPRQGWAAIRKLLHLSDTEFQAIAANSAPYMR